jgi:hypothetical protein
MKIILTETQYKKLIEQQLDLFDNICNTGIDYINFVPQNLTKKVFINLPPSTADERVELYEKIKSSNCDIKLINNVTNEEFTLSPDDIQLSKTEHKKFYVSMSTYNTKIFPNTSKKEQFERYVSSTPITKALEIAFNSNWSPETDTHIAGVIGIAPIKADPNGWSIVNFFNSKVSVKDMIKSYLVRDYQNGIFKPTDDVQSSVINWMSNLFMNINSSEMKVLLNIQEDSINKNFAKELKDANLISQLYHKGAKVDISGFGTKKDIRLGIDATIDGVTYQIKPLSGKPKIDGDNILVNIGLSNANTYKKIPQLDRMAFVNNSGSIVQVFNNDAIKLEGKTYYFNKSDLISPN